MNEHKIIAKSAFERIKQDTVKHESFIYGGRWYEMRVKQSETFTAHPLTTKNGQKISDTVTFMYQTKPVSFYGYDDNSIAVRKITVDLCIYVIERLKFYDDGEIRTNKFELPAGHWFKNFSSAKRMYLDELKYELARTQKRIETVTAQQKKDFSNES